ncbi:MAG: ribulose phosphate epimerase [Myxococcales bacterium]|nr:ribulose phosphate epimerase [Myxococcales bacterium]
MLRTLFCTSLVCGALVLGCGDDGKGDPTGNATNNPTNNPSGNSAEETGAGQSETGGANPTTGVGGSDPGTDTTNDATSNGSNPSTPATTDDGPGTTFIVPTDGGGPSTECDVFAQDCPDGQKCSAYAEGGGNSWNATKCVPVAENPKQPGDACTVEGNGVSGLDDCDLGSYCWDTNAENVGYCVALCTGTPEAPTCESGFVCAVVNQGVLNLCLEACDPLQQDCSMADDLCIPTNDAFLCVLDASGEEGQQHDPCEFANACDSGLACVNSTAASECDPASSGCCEPFCDLSAPDPDSQCTGMGQGCVPWFEEGMAPPDYINVGVCAIPM